MRLFQSPNATSQIRSVFELYPMAHALPFLLRVRWLGALMRRISKTQFNRAIEANSDARPRLNSVPVIRVPRWKHSSRVIPTLLVIIIGIATGWLGGRILNGPENTPPADAPVSEPAGASTLPPTPEGQPHAKHNAAGQTASHPAPAAEEPTDASDPPAAESKPKEVPPKPTKVDKDQGPEKPPVEDPVKEIGREALKKMSKDVKDMRRGNSNKNGNESPR